MLSAFSGAERGDSSSEHAVGAPAAERLSLSEDLLCIFALICSLGVKPSNGWFEDGGTPCL